MGGGTSKKNDDPDDVDVDALVANVRRNERNVFEIPFPVSMTKGKMDGKVVTVKCAPTETVWSLKERIAAVTGDIAVDLTLAYGEGDKHEGKLLFIEDKGPKSFKFDEHKILINQCRCGKKTKLSCNASKDINLDAYDDSNLKMLHHNCERGLHKPMKEYSSAYKKVSYRSSDFSFCLCASHCQTLITPRLLISGLTNMACRIGRKREEAQRFRMRSFTQRR